MRPERVLLYAWSPVCLWEIGSSGHADAAALTFISFALLARLTNRDKLAGGWLGAAALVKLYPIALLPAFVRGWRSRAAWVMAGVIAAGYAIYLRRGVSVFGFLPTFAQEEGMESGTRYFPLAFVERNLHVTIPTFAYLVTCAVVFRRPGLVGLPARRGPGNMRRFGAGVGHRCSRLASRHIIRGISSGFFLFSPCGLGPRRSSSHSLPRTC